MGYRYYKKEGWLGTCDECNMPFPPLYVSLPVGKSIDDYETNKKFVEFLLSHKKEITGWCKACDFYQFEFPGEIKYDRKKRRHNLDGDECRVVGGVPVID